MVAPPTWGPPRFDGGSATLPYFDGRYAHNLTNSPGVNSLLEETNAMCDSIQFQGMGFPPPNCWPQPQAPEHHKSFFGKLCKSVLEVGAFAAAGFLLTGGNPIGAAIGAGVGIIKKLFF